jgi:hypothetical protein
MVLDFNLVDDCPLWLAMLNDATDESQVNLYNQWLWLTPDDILTLQYRPKPSKQKLVPLSRGYHTHVTRFKAMYSELQCTPGWTDLDIFKITYDEYMAFSRQYMAGQITSNPLSPAQNLYASPTDSVALFTKSIKREPKDFPVIKSLNQWDSVKRAVNATATIQLITEVLDHAYIPSAMDKPLFNLKNSYWYKVLVDIIQESSLRAIVNAGPVGDGQTVWTNIVTEAERSTTARISSQSLTAYLTTSKGGSLREPVLSRSVVQSSRMSLFFNQVNQKMNHNLHGTEPNVWSQRFVELKNQLFCSIFGSVTKVVIVTNSDAPPSNEKEHHYVAFHSSSDDQVHCQWLPPIMTPLWELFGNGRALA